MPWAFEVSPGIRLSGPRAAGEHGVGKFGAVIQSVVVPRQRLGDETDVLSADNLEPHLVAPLTERHGPDPDFILGRGGHPGGAVRSSRTPALGVDLVLGFYFFRKYQETGGVGVQGFAHGLDEDFD